MTFQISRSIVTNICGCKQFFCTGRNLMKTHYDILNLKNNCTCKDIKENFIKLSKKYHPDLNKNENAQAQFVKIVTAYNILSKPHLRQMYDASLLKPNAHQGGHNYMYGDQMRRSPWDDPIFYNNRNKSYDSYYQSQPYYGIKGLKKVPNSVIALLCFLIAAFGLCVQIITIRHSFTLRRDIMMRRSEEATAALMEVKFNAEQNGNEKQLQILKAKMQSNGSLNELSEDH